MASSSAVVMTRPVSSLEGASTAVPATVGGSLTGSRSIVALAAVATVPSLTWKAKLTWVSSLAAGWKVHVPS